MPKPKAGTLAAAASSAVNDHAQLFASPWPNALKTPLPSVSASGVAAIKRLFTRFDCDGSNSLSRDEFNTYLTCVDTNASPVDDATFANVYLKKQLDLCGDDAEQSAIAFETFRYFYVLLFKNQGAEPKALDVLNAHLTAAGLPALNVPLPAARLETPSFVDLSDETQPSSASSSLSSAKDGVVDLSVDNDDDDVVMLDNSPRAAPLHSFFGRKRARSMGNDDDDAAPSVVVAAYLPRHDWLAVQPDFPHVPNLIVPAVAPPPSLTTTTTTQRRLVVDLACDATCPRLVDAGVHDEAARLAVASSRVVAPTPPRPAGSEMWTAQYAPRNAAQFVANAAAVEALCTWITDYYTRRNSGDDDDDDNDLAWDDSNRAMGNSAPPVAVLVGPTGSGKTQAVYTAASVLGLGLKEVSGNEDRSKNLLKALVGEATQSGQLKGKRSVARPVLLIDEVDCALDEDADGFLVALRGVVAAAKCPVVLTCNHLAPGLSDDGRNATAFKSSFLVRFARPEAAEVEALVHSAVPAASLGPHVRQGDVRNAWLNAQFWQDGPQPRTAVRQPRLRDALAHSASAAAAAAGWPQRRRLRVDAIAPSRAGPGDWVEVTGIGFAASFQGDELFVEMNCVACTDVQPVSDTRVRARVPLGVSFDALASVRVPSPKVELDSDLEVQPMATMNKSKKKRALGWDFELWLDVVVGFRFKLGGGSGVVRSSDEPGLRHNALLFPRRPDFIPDEESVDEDDNHGDKRGGAVEVVAEEPMLLELPVLDVAKARALRVQLDACLLECERECVADALIGATRFSEDLVDVGEACTDAADAAAATVKRRCAVQTRGSAASEALGDALAAALDRGALAGGDDDDDDGATAAAARHCERAVALGLDVVAPRGLDFVHTVPLLVALARADEQNRERSVSRRFRSAFPYATHVDCAQLAAFGLFSVE